MAETNNPDIARSAAVDFYLSETAPEEHFSVEDLKNICTNADGKCYYVGSKTDASSSATKTITGPAFNTALAMKTKRGR